MAADIARGDRFNSAGAEEEASALHATGRRTRASLTAPRSKSAVMVALGARPSRFAKRCARALQHERDGDDGETAATSRKEEMPWPHS
jgi:hypothetical protein